MKNKIFPDRIFKRCYMIDMVTPFYYVLVSPSLLLHGIFWMIQKHPLNMYITRISQINAIRREVRFFCKKQGVAEREKVHFSYWFNEVYIEVRIRFYRKMSKHDYELFAESCSLASGYKITQLEQLKGCYSFRLFDVINPLPILECKRERMAVGTGLDGLCYWDFSKYPHALIVGATGQGKTNYLRMIIESAYQAEFDIWCIDGKCVDLSLYQNKMKRYQSFTSKEYDEIYALVCEYKDVMNARLKNLKEKQVMKYTDDSEMKPMFLIIEEYSAIMESAVKEFKAEFGAVLSYIVKLSRAVGMQVIFCMQRPDTTYIKGEMRSNLSLRVVCGAGDDACYKMAFDDMDFVPLKIGETWVRQGIVTQVLSVPNMDEIKQEVERYDGTA